MTIRPPNQLYATIDRHFMQYPSRTFAKNQTIIQAGDNPEKIYYIQEGCVREFDINQSGREVVVNIFKPPAFFPVHLAMSRQPSRYFYEAFTEVVVRVAPADDVLRYLRENNDVLYDLLARVYRGAAVLQRRMAHLMGGNSQTRVLFELVVEVERFGDEQDGGSFVLGLHEDELASRSGLSRETVSRELNKLRQANLVTIDHRSIHIHNLKAIRELLDDRL